MGSGVTTGVAVGAGVAVGLGVTLGVAVGAGVAVGLGVAAVPSHQLILPAQAGQLVFLLFSVHLVVQVQAARLNLANTCTPSSVTLPGM